MLLHTAETKDKENHEKNNKKNESSFSKQQEHY